MKTCLFNIIDNNINSKELSNHIEIYLKKAEYLKEKLKRLKNSSSNLNENNQQNIINSQNQGEQNILNHSSSSESLASPSTSTQWEKDENAPLCNGCKSKFSLFNRRHHCRYLSLSYITIIIVIFFYTYLYIIISSNWTIILITKFIFK